MSEQRFESHKTRENEVRGSTIPIPQQTHVSQPLLKMTLVFAAATVSVLAYLLLALQLRPPLAM
jgi:hypothetical protein